MKINISNKILIIFFMFLLFIYNVRARCLDISAKSGILMCADSGSVVFAKKEHECLPMASTTKIMTAILALEHMLAYGNKEIEITPEMVLVEGTSMGINFVINNPC